jgi:Domain of unknown function (DUF4345)
VTTRVFLGLSALVWLPYGLYCFFRPDSLADAAGVTAVTPTAVIELRAMYGGLQAAIGVLAALALVRPRLRYPAVVALLFLCAGLGLSRVAAVVLVGEVSAYTGFAVVLELGSTACAAWLLSRDAARA